MESPDGTYSGSVDLPLRKKRSQLSRRPCSHPEKLLPLSPPPVASGVNDGDSYRTASSDSVRGDGRLKKLKLKLGGVTHTIHAKSTADAGAGGPTIQKSSHLLSAGYSSEKLQLPQDNTHGKNSSYRSNISGKSVNSNEMYNHESVRKSKRVPKRRVIDVGYIEDDDDADDEIRYLGRPNASEKMQKISKVSDVMGDRVFQTYDLSSVGRDGRKISRSENIDNDEDYMEDEESAFDDEPGYPTKKFGSAEQRDDEGFQHTNDISLRSVSSFIEFPNGLPPAPSKKQKPKLTEVEQQLKRAEALQRRRMQTEKAAREAEAEAIRRILGQDSGRKKKEEKLKKQLEELAQEKAAKQDTLGPNTVRWITGPTGSLVIFSDDVGLPNIFSPLPSSYPPPREKCAGPNCTNAYKYRDSKLKIPLCSLSCYKAINGKNNRLVSC